MNKEPRQIKMEKVASDLKKQRAKHGLTVRELAEKIDTNKSTLSRVENGRNCSVKALNNIFVWLKSLGVNIDKY